jgi:hypothetical protein
MRFLGKEEVSGSETADSLKKKNWKRDFGLCLDKTVKTLLPLFSILLTPFIFILGEDGFFLNKGLASTRQD